MQVFTIAADVKVPEQGPVKILELMPSCLAGSRGYKVAYGADMLHDCIIPAYKTHLGRDVKILDSYDLAQEFTKSASAEKAALYYLTGHNYAVGRGPETCMILRQDLKAAHRANGTLVNGNAAFLLSGANKAMQAYIAAEDVITRAYVPRTLVLPSRYSKALADQVRRSLPGVQEFALKLTNQNYGDGIALTDAETLDDVLHDVLVTKRQYRKESPRQDAWSSDITPVFLVQEYVQSHGCLLGDTVYDGTLRVFMTIYRDDETKPFKTVPHGAYWKLPKAPIADTRNFDNTLSQSSHSWRHNTGLHRFFALKAKPLVCGGAIPVSETVYTKALDALSVAIPRLIENTIKRPVHDYVRNWLSAGDNAQIGTAAMMATHPLYYPSIPDTPDEYPQGVIKAFEDVLAGNTDCPNRRYLELRHARPSFHPLPQAFSSWMRARR